MTPGDKDVEGIIPVPDEDEFESKIARTPRANQLAYKFVRLWRKHRAGELAPREDSHCVCADTESN